MAGTLKGSVSVDGRRGRARPVRTLDSKGQRRAVLLEEEEVQRVRWLQHASTLSPFRSSSRPGVLSLLILPHWHLGFRKECPLALAL